jgi:hypothetical protein
MVALNKGEQVCTLLYDRPRWDTRVPGGYIAKKRNIYIVMPLKKSAVRKKCEFCRRNLNEFAPFFGGG